ncbi:DUF590-domain-containing protein [Eremomyces bilateralis CBS 781.70]|uniref:DUF590-domain-containing protein n=1 Tax=Eremomyces bilateralis CBS 781.70 TaxID=1392243 RepID=A0A6G1GAC7_9PEZI|nr:DUF590-domain-containing protein [Eremomyces bilateralis CBS 781.70]KAF1814789.1 DUF590-domain-containing protein [Eremomyces bilateralis CBS 781.70]
MDKHGSKGQAMETNMGVDYVVHYKFTSVDKKDAAVQFEKLVSALGKVGLATEVRQGDRTSLLVFVKVASSEHLYGEIYRSRARDWIHGVQSSAPPKEMKEAIEKDPLTEAERLRIIHQLITNSEGDGGAGITPKEGQWKNVDSIFALHNHQYNKEWIKKWSTSYFLSAEDLDAIRNRLGERIAFYFAFTQSYFSFLLFPAVFGVSAYFLLGHFSPIYAIVNAFWCIIFTEYWKHQEVELAIRWGVRHVSQIENRRREFKHEKEIRDPVTGEMVTWFPVRKRLQRQLLQIPFAACVLVALGSLIATCFGIEIFISEIYNGPMKWLLVFLPTIIVSSFLPILTTIMTTIATQLTTYENYETEGAHETAMTQKIFVINFITSYLGIFLTAFVYVPFGSIVVPYLDVFSVTCQAFAEHEKQLTVSQDGFTINPDRLRKQVIYFTVTAQVVNLAMEVIVPYLKRRGFSKFRQFQNDRAARRGGALPEPSENDHPEEAVFLARVRNEAELDVYDVTTDLREMVLQFGYLSLFSVVWPLTGLSFVFNDWLELRADALKICVEMKRPTPARADTIGSWLDSLSFLTWVGSLTTSALVYMFSNDGLGPDGSPEAITGWKLLLAVMISEHAFLTVRWLVRVAISKLDSPGRQKERRERYAVRRKYIEESLEELSKKQGPVELAPDEEKIDRASLEEDARHAGESNVEDRFWARQRGWRETAQVGAGYIERGPSEDPKEKKIQ